MSSSAVQSASLGIDIGSYVTKVVILTSAGKFVTVPTSAGELGFRMSVYVAPDRTVLFGSEAETEGLRDPGGFIENLKALRASGRAIRDLSVEEIDVQFFKAVLLPAVRDVLGEEPTRAVFTGPAAVDDAYRAALIRSAERAGLAVAALLPECFAAALAAVAGLAQPLEVGSTFATIDVGAWTVDVTLATMKAPGEFLAIGTDGINGHAGRKIMAESAELLLSEVAKSTGAAVTLGSMPPDAQYRFLKQVTTAVESLEVKSSAKVPVEVAKRIQSFELKSADLKKVFYRYAEPVAALFKKLCASAKIDPKSVRRVLLTGGPAKNGHLREALQAALGVPVHLVADPQFAVGRGGAIHDQNLRVAAGTIHRALPALAEGKSCTTMAISVEVVENRAGASTQRVCAVVADAQQPVPLKVQAKFRLQRADQSALQVRVLQGADGTPAEKATELGRLTFPNLPPEKVATDRMLVEVEVRELHVAKVTITDIVSGQIQVASLKL